MYEQEAVKQNNKRREHVVDARHDIGVETCETPLHLLAKFGNLGMKTLVLQGPDQAGGGKHAQGDTQGHHVH